MPPKKEVMGVDTPKLLSSFEDKETKLLAAAFLSSLGPDKYDYDLMATITGNTAGSLKKMWPPVKKKALEAHPSFAAFLGTDGSNIAAPKAAGARKRKAAADSNVEDADPKSAEEQSDGTDKADSKTDSKVETKKKALAKGKGRPAKKSKKEVKDEEDSADGGDGLDNKPKDIEDEV